MTYYRSGEVQALKELLLRAKGRRPWAKGAFVCMADVHPTGVYSVGVNDRVAGARMKHTIFHVPSSMVDGPWTCGRAYDLEQYISMALDTALAACGFSPFKRATRWRIDRDGRRQWQIGQVAK